MRRGFKAQCEQISKRYRKELGIQEDEALPYSLLADHVGVRIWKPEEIPGFSKEHVKQLTVVDKNDWSAVTVSEKEKKVVIVNSSHSERRLANDVTHEIAHLLLDHQKARLDLIEDGLLWLKSYSSEQEEEADWLSASILLPRNGLMKVYKRTQDLETIAGIFEVSTELVRMRVNITGIIKQLQYSKKRA